MSIFHMFEIIYPNWSGKLVYITRYPLLVTSYNNLTKPFSAATWALSLTTIFILSILLFVTHKVYSTFLKTFALAKEEINPSNFFLFPFTKITEPEPLPWFEKWSTGKFVVFLWSALCFFLPMFYNSNLRSHLTMLQYEKAPNTLNDITLRGQRVYIFEGAMRQRYKYLKRFMTNYRALK